MKHKNKNFHLSFLGIVVIVASVVALVSREIAWAFVEPSSSPPGGNVSGPLSITDTEQTKGGGLVLNDNDVASNGLDIANGDFLVRDGEASFSNGNYDDPDSGSSYDAKFGGAGNGIAVGGQSFFNDKVGINDTTPDASLLLDVDGQIGATQYCDENGANCVALTALDGKFVDGAPDIAEAVYTGGNVGIGITDPVTLLHLYDSANSAVHTIETGDNLSRARIEFKNPSQQWRIGIGSQTEADTFTLRDATNDINGVIRVYPGAPSNRLDVSAEGNIGLGNISHPNYAASIQNTIDPADAVARIMGMAGQTGNVLEVRSQSGGGTALTVDANNHLGIGFSGTPTALVDIAGSTTEYAAMRIRNGFPPTTPNAGDIYGNAGGLYWHNGTAWNNLTETGGKTFLSLTDTPAAFTQGSALFTSGSGVAQDDANFFWDDTNDRLGIGTATPAASLDVDGTAFFDCPACGSLTVLNGGGDFGDLAIQGRVLSTNDNLHLSPPAGSNVYINDAYRGAGGAGGGVAGLLVEGNVGIGSNGGVATHKLDVRGTVRVDVNESYDVWIQGGSATSGDARNLALLGQKSSDMLHVGYNGEWDIVRLGPSQYVQVYAAGAYKPIYASSFVYGSDARLKNNIRDLENTRDILRIAPRRFDWNNPGEWGDNDDIGVIAQDVETFFPEFVHVDTDGYKAVNYPKLVVPLLGVVQEQEKRIEALEAHNASVEQELDVLRNDIDALTQSIER